MITQRPYIQGPFIPQRQTHVELHLDFETRSECDLKARGVLRYALDPSTAPLMLAWAVDQGPVQQVEFDPYGDPKARANELPADLVRMLLEPSAIKVAQNYRFERLILLHQFGIDVPIEQWRDTMVMAFRLSLPGNLSELGDAIGVDEAKKDKRGDALIKLFCKPRAKNRKGPRFNDSLTHPKEWQEFLSYNRQDVTAERKIHSLLRRFEVPAREEEIWHLDEHSNDRGMPVDVDFLRAAWAMVQDVRRKKLDKIKELTGVSNPNSGKQLLAWLKTVGYPFDNLRKESVAAAIEDFDLGEIGNQVLRIWKYAAKTSVNKYKQMLDIQVDGRLCYCFQYGGASRTLRWAGRKPQLQNLASRFDSLWSDNLDDIRQLVADGNDEWIELMYGDPVDALVACIRTAIKAPEGYSIVCADLGSIESRALGEVSKCRKIVDVFESGKDMYKTFAAQLFKKAYDAVTKSERTFCKPPVLGSGFGLGAGEIVGEYPLEEWTGLLGYAKNMGVILTVEDAEKMTALFRHEYLEVVNCWYALEEAAIKAVRTKERTRVMAKDPVSGEWGRYPLDVWFDVKAPFLRIELPSGRFMYYLRPKVRSVRMWSKKKQKYYTKDELSYEGYNDKKKWGRIKTYGGKFIENFCQAWARDIMAEGMLKAAKRGFDLVGSVHDELITLVREQSAERATRILVKIMSQKPEWHGGIILGAEGFNSPYYRK